ncbi:MAG: enoyl-CoA hydratase/isomerase family protein [Caulobacterales bacterium]|nr:enoyl-CoA hydratase/isomerase family protein [Caulobacterales bacterium]
MENNAPVSLNISQEGIAFVTLNRPEKRNAFDEIMISALNDIFLTLKGADNVRIIFIKGAGHHFCAGADLEWMQRQARHDIEDNERDALDLAQMLNHLYNLPQITVALVEGGAYGGGLGLIACCDYSIATEKSHFCFSETRIGLVPATISPYVIEAIGVKNARGLFTLAMPFDAHQAKAIGLIQEIALDSDDFAKREERLADLGFCASPNAIAKTKETIDLVKNREIDSHLMKETAKIIAHARAADDGIEGLSAFLEKRKPNWIKT